MLTDNGWTDSLKLNACHHLLLVAEAKNDEQVISTSGSLTVLLLAVFTKSRSEMTLIKLKMSVNDA